MACLPEELLERILAHAIPPPRPLWLRSPTASTARLAPLSVSRQFHRIAAPLLYRSVHLTSPSTADLLLRTLCARPEYAQHIRELAILGLWSPVVAVLRLCPAISSLDLTIAFEDGADVDLGVFAALTEMRHLTLRKPPSVYLSLARPRALITSLARAITAWPRLSTATIAFKLSDDTPTSPTSSFHPFSVSAPPSAPSGPITALATALAAAPALHTFSTHLPSVWNASIASVASNPALERICLYPASSRPDAAPGPAAIPGTGLFLMEARRHPRLAELIAAGTPIIRSRAHTLGSAAAAAAAAAPAPATTTTATTTMTQQKPAIGLGLRIDTSAEAISGAEAPASRRYRSGVAGHANASGSGSGGINPAWMGPVRTPSSAGGKGKGRRV